MEKSKYTSINSKKLPKAYALLSNSKVRSTIGEPDSKCFVLDHGCGRYTSHLEARANNLGYDFLGWDEYWHTEPDIYSWEVVRMMFDRGCKYSSWKALHISSNVMNVITDDWELQEYCTRVYDSMNVGEYLILTVYEAEKPSETQRAEPLALYVEKLESYYGLITVRQTKGYAILTKD